MSYETDWIRVGTAGKTIDGREIQEQWLDDMAATYDPKEYCAQIWAWSHTNKYVTSGKVTAVKVGWDEKGRKTCLVKLQPLPELVGLNQAGQLKHSSMEITPNYNGKGKAYLSGLVLTNYPASLGTEEIHLTPSQNPILLSVAYDFAADLTDPAEQVPKWFKNFAKLFFPEPKKNNDEVDQLMTSEQFQKFEAAQALQLEATKKQTEAVQALSAKFDTLKPTEPAPSEKPAAEPPPAPVALSAEQITEIVKQQIEAFAAKPSGKATTVPVNTGTSDPANPAEWAYDF